MSEEIKNVTIVGASGNVGAPVLRALLDANCFTITVLIRPTSTSTFPPGPTVEEVDFDSHASLVSALKGQDAVICTVPEGVQQPIIDAAVAAGVRRFILSEFGLDTRTITTDQLEGLGKIMQGKVQMLEYIQNKSKENPGFTWTAIKTGPFFDWGLAWGSLGFEKKTKTAQICDSGNERFPACNLPFVGKAVVAVLQHLDKTANAYLEVASFNTTQNDILALIKKNSSDGAEWNVIHTGSTEIKKAGLESLGKGDFFGGFIPLLMNHWFADGAGRALKLEDSANAILGLAEEDPESAIKAWLAN
ncbi:uncharacterized protein BCR38DRAFT_408848 [Pseudomassariella vexata]|uniref:NmrA-like domain-containing protein n=1 Tax=Pseudomassariella vexata TaxID=1141098 RepID=A0A1Y2E2L1_9PEZI|nr:uncharacterized protein BCR38DRAFT_408848 [Pseudomassariella vexata]ORY65105.1 hypothetical protein BCR38DRAFT_408848 [Pseudomassariella vexata]